MTLEVGFPMSQCPVEALVEVLVEVFGYFRRQIRIQHVELL